MFDPLGLRRTSFEPGDLHGDYVHGYRAPSHQGVVTGAPVDIGAEPARWTWAAGGIVSTPGDVQNTRDASRQLVLVVNTYPLSGELEAAVRRAQLEAFCDGS